DRDERIRRRGWPARPPAPAPGARGNPIVGADLRRNRRRDPGDPLASEDIPRTGRGSGDARTPPHPCARVDRPHGPDGARPITAGVCAGVALPARLAAALSALTPLPSRPSPPPCRRGGSSPGRSTGGSTRGSP